MKTTLKRLSVCVCGFPTLKDGIQLGAEYDIDPDRTVEATFTCGGCQATQKVKAVWVEARNTGTAGFLPLQIFKEPTYSIAWNLQQQRGKTGFAS